MCGCVTSSSFASGLSPTSPTSPDVIPLTCMSTSQAVSKTVTKEHVAAFTNVMTSQVTPKRFNGTSLDDVMAMRCYNNQMQTDNRRRSTSADCTCRRVPTPVHKPFEKRTSWGLDSLRRYDASYQYDAAMDDNSLQHASWYQAGIPREIALEILSQEEIGSFIVRDSTTHPSCFALSVRVPKFENPTGISHYLIKQTSRGGFMLKGLDKEWPNLTSLVTHHTVMQEKLPCTLRLPRNSQNPTYHDVLPDQDLDVQDGADDDDDYQRLSDFTSMMADLKMEK